MSTTADDNPDGAASRCGDPLFFTDCSASPTQSNSLTLRNNTGLDDYATVVQIATDGDVIFSFSTDPQKRAIRVHSAALKLASRVFRAMFGPHFGEGQILEVEQPTVVPLPEDDVEAMITVCKVLHLHDIQGIHHPTQQLLRKIAFLADKCDLSPALRITSEFWLREYIPGPKTEKTQLMDSGTLLVASFLLDAPVAFRDITRGIIQHYPLSFSTMGSSFDDNPTDPWSMLGKEQFFLPLLFLSVCRPLSL